MADIVDENQQKGQIFPSLEPDKKIMTEITLNFAKNEKRLIKSENIASNDSNGAQEKPYEDFDNERNKDLVAEDSKEALQKPYEEFDHERN